MIGAVGLLFAVTMARDAALRPSCETATDQTVVGTLPAGTAVEIRFAVADGSNCYKIAANVDGKPLLGYVDGSALANTQSFEDQRRGGASLDGVGQSRVVVQGLAGAARDTVHGSRIVDLLNAHQPAKALEHIEPLLKNDPRNPGLLALASVAAYQSDDLKRAQRYCRDALAVSEDSRIAGFCQTVERESKADKSGEKLYGMRVALRYEGEALPADVARTMVSIVDQEFIRISGQLGCPAEERITVIVQSRDAYLRTTNAAEWSGGLYDGRIHVALAAGQPFGPDTRRTFAHETVHACLANIGTFPAWLHEGLAQKLSGAVLSSIARDELRTAIRSGAIPKLENLGQNWSRMSAQNARLAYNLALAATDTLVDDYAAYGLRNLLRNPDMLQQATAQIDKTLGL